MEQPKDPTNEDIRASFAEIYHAHKRPIYGYCLHMLGDPEAAKDLVQQTFTALHQHGSQIRDRARISAWLFTTARRFCYSHLLRETRAGDIKEQMALEIADSSSGAGPESNQHMAAAVTLALRRLKPELREVVILREYQRMSYREIADTVQCPESTIKFRLHEARRQLCTLLRHWQKGAQSGVS